MRTRQAAISLTRLNSTRLANSWTTKAATYADNQVNNMACGVLTDAGTPYIYCVGGSAAGATTSADRVFRYNPATDTSGPGCGSVAGRIGGYDSPRWFLGL